MKWYVEFYWKDKFYRWGLYYRDPKKFISFHHVCLGGKSRKQRLKDFFYFGVYANFKYWLILVKKFKNNVRVNFRWYKPE